MKLLNKKGFTLIELLIVIAVMAILTTVVFVALNPLARFQDSRNSRRWTDINAILSAIKLDQVDNGGLYMSLLTNSGGGEVLDNVYYQIGTSSGLDCDDSCTDANVVLQTDCVDISALSDDGYLPRIPVDPNAVGAGDSNTFYYLMKNNNGSFTVGACFAEMGSKTVMQQIEVTR